MLLGWRLWYEDGTILKQTTFEQWCASPDDGMYGKILYFTRKPDSREIQQNDWYYVAPHPSGEFIHGTCMDNQKDETEKRYPGAVFKRGKWGPPGFYRELTDKVFGMTWDGS